MTASRLKASGVGFSVNVRPVASAAVFTAVLAVFGRPVRILSQGALTKRPSPGLAEASAAAKGASSTRTPSL
ncbi:MAG TPA: hypothetical protein VGS07_02205 [Thermoanaerobaculia bacterium]|nr:hypothetical protein [Thermoanaerobaculia bacterium]